MELGYTKSPVLGFRFHDGNIIVCHYDGSDNLLRPLAPPLSSRFCKIARTFLIKSSKSKINIYSIPFPNIFLFSDRSFN